MKINLELSDEELSKFNQVTLENHIIAHADKIAKSVFKDTLSKGLRGGEIQLKLLLRSELGEAILHK